MLSLIKFNLHYETVIDQMLNVFHQLLSFNSAGPLKCPIRKMVGSQGHLTVWAVPRLQCVLTKKSFTEDFSKLINFQITYCKKFHCLLSKYSQHCLTAYWSKASSLLPTDQLDFSWTLEMSNWQNYRFVRSSDSVSSFLSTLCRS